VPSACWPYKTTQKCVGWITLIAGYTHQEAVWLSKIEVTLWACGPPCLLGSSRKPRTSRIFQLGSGTLQNPAFMIDKMVVLTFDVTIGSIDSSTPGQCHENSWQLFSPTVFPVISGSTSAIVKLNGWTLELVEGSQPTFNGNDWWFKVC